MGRFQVRGSIGGERGRTRNDALRARLRLDLDQVTSGWPAIFLLNVPLAAATIGFAWRYVPAGPQAKAASLDLAGAVLATAALGSLAWGLTVGSGPGGWTSAAVSASVFGLALALGFLRVEQQRGDRAMMPLALFGSRTFVGLSLLTLLLYGVLAGFLVLLPYVLITSAGYTATATGAALLPLPLVLVVASPVMGVMAGRVGARRLLAVGSLIVAGGLRCLRVAVHRRYGGAPKS